MSYSRTNVIIADGTRVETVYNAEKIGRNLTIHRAIEENAMGDLDAIGKTWTVTLHPFGAALVTGISSRAQARRIARSLVLAVDDFKRAVMDARENVDEPYRQVSTLSVL